MLRRSFDDAVRGSGVSGAWLGRAAPEPLQETARWRIAPGLLALLALALAVHPARAQELPLKRTLPPEPEPPCVAAGFGSEPSARVPDRDRDEAERLAGEASQAAILGNRSRAQELLVDAARLDPTSASIAYRLGRLLEDAGSPDDALPHYCRFLTLEPDDVDASDVERRVDRIAPVEDVLPAPARAAFREGIERFDGGQFEEAARYFSRAVIEVLDWDVAYYNRAIAHLRLGRESAGFADLERYLELRPDAEDRQQVAARLGVTEPRPVPTARGYSASTALFTGLLVPGMGHFYSDRPVLGFAYLLAAGGSAAFGLFYEEVELRCRIIPVDNHCPAEDILERNEDRPYLAHGLVAAGVLTVLGAVHASLSVSGRVRPGSSGSSGLGLSVPLPLEGRGGAAAALTLEPTVTRASTGLRAAVRLPLP